MVQPKKKIATRKIKIFPNVRVKLCGRADIVVRADFEQRTRGLSMFSICDYIERIERATQLARLAPATLLNWCSADFESQDVWGY